MRKAPARTPIFSWRFYAGAFKWPSELWKLQDRLVFTKWSALPFAFCAGRPACSLSSVKSREALEKKRMFCAFFLGVLGQSNSHVPSEWAPQALKALCSPVHHLWASPLTPPLAGPRPHSPPPSPLHRLNLLLAGLLMRSLKNFQSFRQQSASLH